MLQPPPYQPRPLDEWEDEPVRVPGISDDLMPYIIGNDDGNVLIRMENQGMSTMRSIIIDLMMNHLQTLNRLAELREACREGRPPAYDSIDCWSDDQQSRKLAGWISGLSEHK